MESKKYNFCHLHNHSYFSLLDGLSSPNDLAKTAAEMGFPALALTDHGSCGGLLSFQKDCNEVGAPDPCASEHSILVSEIMPNFILVKKCGQLRKLSTMTRMEMDNDTESIFYEIDQSDCNKKCDSYYRCARVYACGYLLREDEVIKRIDDKGDKQHGKNNI